MSLVKDPQQKLESSAGRPPYHQANEVVEEKEARRAAELLAGWLLNVPATG